VFAFRATACFDGERFVSVVPPCWSRSRPSPDIA
jgi:hypothetical protein